jgi:hypothetical protein
VTRPLPPLGRRGVALVVALALLLAQAIGLAHALAHPAAHAHSHDALSSSVAHEDDGWFDAHHDEGSAQCQLLDQLTHADGPPPAAAGWAFAAPQATLVAAPTAPRRATAACGYHARGPPRVLA